MANKFDLIWYDWRGIKLLTVVRNNHLRSATAVQKLAKQRTESHQGLYPFQSTADDNYRFTIAGAAVPAPSL